MHEIIIEARIENMEAVLDFINGYIKECPPKSRNQIMIASDEIFSNIAHYAYNPPIGDAAVRIFAANDIITIEFVDSGREFNPLSIDPPDVSQSAEEREIGGLGIFMVKNIMDSVEYRREDNKNILTIKKTLQ